MTIKIILFNTATYYPGQVVEGKVVCYFKNDKNFRGIYIKLNGKEHTTWSENESYTENGESKTRAVQYFGDNEFLKLQHVLVGAGIFRAGQHEFPFQFTIPTNSPSTYKSNNGYISYELKANVDLPMRFDYKDKAPLTVLPFIQLNTVSDYLMNPIHLQDEKTICCCCCAGGSITMDAYLEREVFIVGEPLKLKVEIVNMSNQSIQHMEIKLKSVITEKVTSPATRKKVTSTTLTTELATGVGAHGHRTYDFNVHIPPDKTIPNFEICKLFQQVCILKIQAVIPAPHTNLKMEQLVKFGHNFPRGIPTNSQVPPAYSPPCPPSSPWMTFPESAPMDEDRPSAPRKEELAASNPSPNSPPSYEDVMNKKY